MMVMGMRIKTLFMLMAVLMLLLASCLRQRGPESIERPEVTPELPVTTSTEPYLKKVRIFDPDNFAFSNPKGLAYSPETNAFFVTNGAGENGRGTNIVFVTPFEDLLATTHIEDTFPGAVSMTFDSVGERLLIFKATTSTLMEISLGSNGKLDPSTLVHIDARHFGLQNAQGMSFNPVSGQLLLLDAHASRVVRVERGPQGSFEEGTVSETQLGPAGLVNPRGLAYHPSTGNLHLLDRAGEKLVELTESGEVVAIRDLSSFELSDPQGIVFAPSSDLTDDPLKINLFVVDSGFGAKKWPGSIIEFAFTDLSLAGQSLTTQATDIVSLVQTIYTSQFTPASPDPAGITYDSTSDELVVSDSEVNEIPSLFTGDNQFVVTRGGVLVDTWTTYPNSSCFSNEPTGVTYRSSDGHLFYSDDDQKEIFEVTPGANGSCGVVVNSFDTTAYSSNDPEGITYANEAGQDVLYIADGINNEIYR
ncbi:MAG: hypothetical protein JSV66_15940, partial [Trueperaceae bacterium]